MIRFRVAQRHLAGLPALPPPGTYCRITRRPRTNRTRPAPSAAPARPAGGRIRTRVPLPFLLCCALLCCATLQVTAQRPVLLRNPSLEGPPRRMVAPPKWLACDSVSTPDTQPFPPHRLEQKSASHGTGFMSLVCRGEYRDFMTNPPGSYEGAWQLLTEPLAAGETYCLALDMAFPGENSLNGGQQPAVLRIFGGDARGRRVELLWTSPVVGHLSWRTYAAYLRPGRTHVSLVVECHFAPPVAHWGAVVVDNLRSDAVLAARMLGPDTTICLSDSVLLAPTMPGGSALHPVSYRWSDGSTFPVLAAREAGWYWVEVYDGCFAYRDTVRVTTRECEGSFFIPNVITPNGDGANDTFAFRGLSPEGWRLAVVNRWGRQVHAVSDYRQDWTADGLPEGVYFYRLEKPGFKPITGCLHVVR